MSPDGKRHQRKAVSLHPPPLHAAKKTQQPAASVFPRNRTFLIPFRLRHQQYARRADVLKFTYCSKNKKGGDRSKKRVSVTSLTLFVQFCERQDAQIRLLKKGAKQKHIKTVIRG